MSLRERLIEAGARVVYEADVERMVNVAAPKLMLLPEWDELPEDDVEVYSRRAAQYLAAFLDTLAENADEWADSGREFDTISSAGNVTDKGYVWRLIAVLRGDE